MTLRHETINGSFGLVGGNYFCWKMMILILGTLNDESWWQKWALVH